MRINREELDLQESQEVEEFNTHGIFEREFEDNTKGRKNNMVIPTLDLNNVHNTNASVSSKKGRPPLHPKSGRSTSDLNALQSLDSLENLLEGETFPGKG